MRIRVVTGKYNSDASVSAVSQTPLKRALEEPWTRDNHVIMLVVMVSSALRRSASRSSSVRYATFSSEDAWPSAFSTNPNVVNSTQVYLAPCALIWFQTAAALQIRRGLKRLFFSIHARRFLCRHLAGSWLGQCILLRLPPPVLGASIILMFLDFLLTGFPSLV